MPYEQSIVAQWNELMLDAIRSGSAKPTETTYQLHLVSSAIYDAWAAYDTAAYGHYGNIERPVGEHTEANKAEAVSYAAYRALVDFFPNQKATFDAFMEAQGYDPAVASTDPSTAAGVGNLAAQTVLAAREGDGSNRENGYKDTTGYVAEQPRRNLGVGHRRRGFRPERLATAADSERNADRRERGADLRQ